MKYLWYLPFSATVSGPPLSPWQASDPFAQPQRSLRFQDLSRSMFPAMMIFDFWQIVSRGGGGVPDKVAALLARRLQDVDDGLLQRALPRLVHRLHRGVRLGPAPPWHRGGLAWQQGIMVISSFREEKDNYQWICSNRCSPWSRWWEDRLAWSCQRRWDLSTAESGQNCQVWSFFGKLTKLSNFVKKIESCNNCHIWSIFLWPPSRSRYRCQQRRNRCQSLDACEPRRQGRSCPGPCNDHARQPGGGEGDR